MKKALKRDGEPAKIATDGLRSYPAAMTELGNLERREMGQWLNNRAENSHLPFRRRERAMLSFRQMKSLQKFASVHANIHNHFAQERHLVDRQTYKERRSAALAEWQNLAALGMSADETFAGAHNQMVSYWAAVAISPAQGSFPATAAPSRSKSIITSAERS